MCLVWLLCVPGLSARLGRLLEQFERPVCVDLSIVSNVLLDLGRGFPTAKQCHSANDCGRHSECGSVC